MTRKKRAKSRADMGDYCSSGGRTIFFGRKHRKQNPKEERPIVIYDRPLADQKRKPKNDPSVSMTEIIDRILGEIAMHDIWFFFIYFRKVVVVLTSK